MGLLRFVRMICPCDGRVDRHRAGLAGHGAHAIRTLVNGLIVITTGSLAAFLARRPVRLRIQRYLTGTVLGVLAVSMATDRSKALVTS